MLQVVRLILDDPPSISVSGFISASEESQSGNSGWSSDTISGKSFSSRSTSTSGSAFRTAKTPASRYDRRSCHTCLVTRFLSHVFRHTVPVILFSYTCFCHSFFHVCLQAISLSRVSWHTLFVTCVLTHSFCCMCLLALVLSHVSWYIIFVTYVF